MSKALSGKVFLLFIFLIIVLGFISVAYLHNLFNVKPAFLKISNLSPLTSEPVSVSLNLSSPDNNLMVFDSDLLVDGTTSPNATVIITTADFDKVILANSSGRFSYTLSLEEGVNEFQITAFDSEGNSKSEFRSVYYSEEKI